MNANSASSNIFQPILVTQDEKVKGIMESVLELIRLITGSIIIEIQSPDFTYEKIIYNVKCLEEIINNLPDNIRAMTVQFIVGEFNKSGAICYSDERGVSLSCGDYFQKYAAMAQVNREVLQTVERKVGGKTKRRYRRSRRTRIRTMVRTTRRPTTITTRTRPRTRTRTITRPIPATNNNNDDKSNGNNNNTNNNNNNKNTKNKNKNENKNEHENDNENNNNKNKHQNKDKALPGARASARQPSGFFPSG